MTHIICVDPNIYGHTLKPLDAFDKDFTQRETVKEWGLIIDIHEEFEYIELV